MVVEYERIFRYGYKPPKAVMKPAGTTTYDKHKSFLQTAMMPGFLHNKGQGGDDLLQIWQSISEYNETLETRLVRLEYGAEGVMIAYMDSDSTITLKRLEKCLLSISGGEDYKCLSLASKLLGQRLVVPMSVRFEWDEMNNRISSMHYEPDFLTPLLKILGNLEETTRVLNSTMAYPNL
ncbi:hypothetical protein PHMEG_0004338 [Phytophthora megakarya]|uniref:Uncharacterized protein n=1 Tax=Phytophthora megakarya TaxID=4795 RepID=A0A225WVP7_9STRA|nr:hypothetical protein PHMEG_0004338 [Phytophthora megakarya]